MKKLLTIFSFVCIFLPLWAGITPKPEMDFTLVYPTGTQLTVLADTSEQIQCQDNQCLQSDPLGSYGIQKLYCQRDSCFSIAYEYAPYQQLVLHFSDGVKRGSNVFATPNKLRNHFNVIVGEKNLQVELAPLETPINTLLRVDAWVSLLSILILEMLAAWAYLWYTGKSRRILVTVFLVNLLTMPLSWQVLAMWVPEPWFLWSFCLVCETLLLWGVHRKRLHLRDAFNLSIAMNVTSYTLGMIISFILAPYLF